MRTPLKKPKFIQSSLFKTLHLYMRRALPARFFAAKPACSIRSLLLLPVIWGVAVGGKQVETENAAAGLDN
jgi:hypothetical protein